MMVWRLWVLVGLLIGMMTGCAQKTAPSPDNTDDDNVTLKNPQELMVIDTNETDKIVSSEYSSDGKTKTLVLSSSFDGNALDGKKIVTIPSCDAFPLGFSGKILSKRTRSDGKLEVTLEDAVLTDIFEKLHRASPKKKLGQLKFIGTILPTYALASGANNQVRQLRLKELKLSSPLDPHAFTYNGDDIIIDTEAEDHYKRTLAKTEPSGKYMGATKELSFVIKGKIENITVEENGDIDLTAFSEHINFAADMNLEAYLEAKGVYHIGNLSQIWKDFEEASYNLLKIKGINANDKKGKIPLAGFVYNGLSFSPGTTDLNTKAKLASAGGIISRP